MQHVGRADVPGVRALPRPGHHAHAMDVFSLITTAERQLASTRWDTGTARRAGHSTSYPLTEGSRPERRRLA